MSASKDGSLSPTQLTAVKFMEYAMLSFRVTFKGLIGTVILAGWYGGAGEIEMV